MIRFFTLLAVAAVLAACDTGVVEPPVAEVSVGTAYRGETLALRDLDSGAVDFDFLAAGATIEIEFTDADAFEATLFVPYQALVDSGETDDLDGDIDQQITGTYRQIGGVLTMTADAWVDSFFTDGGWTIDDGGGAVRYADHEGDQELVVVLERQ